MAFPPPHPPPPYSYCCKTPGVKHPIWVLALHWPKGLKVLPCCKYAFQGWAETQADSCSLAKLLFDPKGNQCPQDNPQAMLAATPSFPSNPQPVWGQFNLPNSLDWKRAKKQGTLQWEPWADQWSDTVQIFQSKQHSANTIFEADIPCRPCSSAISAMCQWHEATAANGS